MDKDLDILEREVGEYRAEARTILDRAGGADLTGDAAATFDRLTAGIEERNEQIREMRDRRDRAAELTRAVRDPAATRMRLEAGSTQPLDRDEDAPPVVRDLDGQRLAFDTTMAATLTRSVVGGDRRD
jgi:hypothetical protein